MPARLKRPRVLAAVVAVAIGVVVVVVVVVSGGPTGPAATCAAEVLPPKPGGGHWQCTFDDEFDAQTGDAHALNTSWWAPQTTSTSGYNTGTIGALACYLDSPDTIAVSGGALHLTVRKLGGGAPSQCGPLQTQFVAGMVTTVHSFSQTYGRFEVRALLPQTNLAGLQETLWLWPENSARYGSVWPDSGEVDFAEFYSRNAGLDVPAIHYNFDSATAFPATHSNVATAYCPIDPSRYNVYAVVWTPGNFTITVNGKTCLIDNYTPDNGLTSPQPFDQPFFIALTQALGIGTNAFDPSTTPLPATTSIDYVRVWK